MVAFVTLLILGLVMVAIGAVNMTGNISSIHAYHRHRVTEANRKPFGRRVGLGTVICGVAVATFGTLFFIYEKTGNELLVWIGTGLLLLGLAVGLVISLRAIMKYNGGIF